MKPNRVLSTTVASPLGLLLLTSDGVALTGLYLEGHKGGPVPGEDWQVDDLPRELAAEPLAAYFAGERGGVEATLSLRGTEFQRRVWDALRTIPFGMTIGYGELARRVGVSAGAARAVGAAVGRNPISILVPCHRVVGASGALTGYAGGIARKRWLLDHEQGSRAGAFTLISEPRGRGAAVPG